MTDRLPGSGRPVIVCGSLRAGTTLLRLLLGQHSQLSGHGESDFLFDDAPLDQNGQPLGPEALEHYRKVCVTHRPAVRNGFSVPKGETFPAMVSDLLAQHQATAPHLLLTLHRNTHHASRVLKDAFYIRLQRDPRDVALSSVAMGWGGIPYYGLDPWIESERHWLIAKDLIPAENQTFVRYEDLTSDPRGELTRILEAAGLAFEEACLTPKGSTYSSPESRPAEAFRKKLTARQISEMNSRLTWVSPDYGYNLQPAQPPTGFRKIALAVEGKRQAVAWRIGRYGFPLYFKSMIANRLGLEGLRSSVHQEMEAITVKYLK